MTAGLAAIWLLLHVFGRDVPGDVSRVRYETLKTLKYFAQVESLYLGYCVKAKVADKVCAADSRTVAALIEDGYLSAFDESPIKRKLDRQKSAWMQEYVKIKNCAEASCKGRKRVFEKFLGLSLKKNKKVFAKYSEWHLMKKLEDQADHTVAQWARKDASVLTSSSISWHSLLDAQFRHSSVEHVGGNSLFLVIFGIAVESYLPFWVYIPTVIAAGGLGMFVSASLLPTGVYLVGGSAMVSAVIGMFYILFFRRNMQILCWFPSFGSSILQAPVKLMLPILMVIPDLVGIIDGLVEAEGQGVAYEAHFSAFVSGGLAASLLTLFLKRPHGFLFQAEVESYQQMLRIENLEQQLKVVSILRKVNPDNPIPVGVVLYRGFIQLAKEPNSPQAGLILDFAKESMPSLLAVSVKLQFEKVALGVLMACPVDFWYSELSPGTGQYTWLRLAQFAAANGKFYVSIRCMDAYLSSFPNARQSRNVEKSIESLVGYLASIGSHDGLVALTRSLTVNSSRAAVERSLNSTQLAGAPHAS